jgi:hypothetical protein
MKQTREWHRFLFDSSAPFEERYSSVFQFQFQHNPCYRKFIKAIGWSPETILEPDELPLLPIRAFKMREIITEGQKPEIIFKSSGTSGMNRSKHSVADLKLYKQAITGEFYRHFSPDEFSLLCHMPGYKDNPDSSLIWMASHLIAQDKSGLSGFISSDPARATKRINNIREAGKKPVLFGAAFGFMDLLNSEFPKLPENSLIIETGGMKTHRREMTKTELRSSLSDRFGIPESQIHSEYGMCELLSQMYAIGGEWFSSPHWVKVSVRDPQNPSQIREPGEEGKIGIIDLANVYSCPFILTEDRGMMAPDGRFRVLGRWNPADLRGCNFLIDRD